MATSRVQSGPVIPASVGVRFEGFFVRAAAFAELPGAEATPPAPGQTVPVSLEIQAVFSQGETPEGRAVAEVHLHVNLEPDPSLQPYHLKVSVTGVFAALEGVGAEDFKLFCRHSTPAILWPYIRQLVSALTADARYGPLRLDPVNVAGMLNQAKEEQLTPPTGATKQKTRKRKTPSKR